MEKSIEDLFGFLTDSGKIGMIRKHMISFLLSVEGSMTDENILEDCDDEETGDIVGKRWDSGFS